ncbi:MAG: secretin [Candidatus Dactylopiibacterium carminicum]|uniref:Type IV pilus biogenesis and competence protein PilQ n=1 Tax=Candidatus Dactylopiibacterium carminicum TaxID=857335 RepID=A0A272EQJ1_9RHOO|nr:type IV pilus secretin PilQ [Candidatus Dactylopiibacterium carminicum]KAF7598605.1 type IV pilus secretin PilQ [Candidatus Dactylopiibacterium carminicum]PAS92358.1 MAG: secretin [Candidatus Dactylopiibacterium carminicum]PAS95804.1 MAG: secretin [Candidatus Dactylopiibacterium carminicum]PAS98371.1 MAG: secretin [Candidatus Dactylopiibacterium carminicum]
MKSIKRLIAPVFCAVTGLVGLSGAYAQSAPVKETRSVIESIQSTVSGGVVTIRIGLSQALTGQLSSFSVSNPARIAVDLPSTANGLDRSVQNIGEGDVRSVNLVQVADRTRLVVNLLKPLSYEARVEGKDVVISLAAAVAKSAELTTTARFAEQPGGPDTHAIRDINFRRGKDGEGRVVIDLSDTNTGIDIRQAGSNLIVDFLKTSLPERLRRNLDVTDFGTPVTGISTTEQESGVRMVITPTGLWEHNAYQTDSQFVLEVKSVQEDPRKLVQGGSRAVKYAGEKLSLNFQNIGVREVLQVIADFTNFNIVTSDSVAGSLTLRLKDVPWDQALEIVLQAKGLDMRKNGNVIWIAPREELAAREKLELESKQQIGDLEPLRTETFQINYHSSKAIYDGVLKDKEKTILSKRGSVIMDERTNKLIVTDTAARLDDVRRMLNEIDVPSRQVIIEAQIIEAEDTFAKNLGARFGVTQSKSLGTGGSYTLGGSPAQNTYTTTAYTGVSGTQYATADKPDLSDVLNFPNAASSISGKSAGQIGLTLLSAGGTGMLNLELSALESDGRGRVVSRPRVMTADQIEAVIEQGVEIPYQTATSSGATAIQFRKANLSLKVKPQITPDGRVSMMLDVNKDTPNTQISTGAGVAIDTKHVKSEVLVDNGGTVVIGGIFQQEASSVTTKIPLLGDIPFLGALFRNKESKDNKTELLVFITPRILTDQVVTR